MFKSHLKYFIISILVSIFFIACQDNSSSLNEASFISPDLDDYSMMDAQDIMADLSDATTNQDMGWGENITGEFKGKFKKHRHGRIILGKILKDLNLSEDQKELVKGYIEANRSSAKEIHEAFKPEIQDILDAAKESRKAIMDQVKDGEITREEAKTLIDNLNEETRSAIEATEGFEEMKEELCSLTKSLFDQIAGVLTEDQLVLWNDWLSGLEGDCING